jgi:hypothetical protein
MIHLYALFFKLFARAAFGGDQQIQQAETTPGPGDAAADTPDHEMQRHDQSRPAV